MNFILLVSSLTKLTWRHCRIRFRMSALVFPIVFAAIAHAQAGPPFRTDDPETPGNKHWEINFSWLADRNPQEGSYSIPDFDVNYGLGDRIQLKYELPIAVHEDRGNSGEVQNSPPMERHVAVGL